MRSYSPELKIRKRSANNFKTAVDIFEAARIGDLNSVKYWIEKQGIDINIKSSGYSPKTPLQVACANGHLEIVKYLLVKKADVNGTQLESAVENGHLDVVKYLIEEKAVDIKSDRHISFNLSLIRKVTEKGYLNLMKYLIEKTGVDINSDVFNGQTLLHVAAYYSPLDVFKYLVEEKKVDLNTKTYRQETALYIAAEWERFEIVKYLVEKGADVTIANSIEEFSVLHAAALNGPLDAVKYLVENKGIDPNIKSHSGYTPLMWAANGGQLNIVKYLTEERKVNVNATDSAGGTALHLAAERGAFEIVKYLITQGRANVNVKDTLWGDLPTHKAVKYGSLTTLKYLIEEEGADINAANNDGETLLHIAAADEKKLDIVQYLVDRKEININMKNHKGETPLTVARNKGNSKIIEYLEKPGRLRKYRSVDKSAGGVMNMPSTIMMSSANKPSLFIGSLFHWLTNSITGFLLPSMSLIEESVIYPDISNSVIHGILILLNLSIRKFSGNNYKPSIQDSILSPKDLIMRRIDPIMIQVIEGTRDPQNVNFLNICPAYQPSNYLNVSSYNKNVRIHHRMYVTSEYVKLPTFKLI